MVWYWSAVVVWSWSASSSATMVWSWSNEKNGDWGDSDRWRFNQAACGLMLIGGSGVMLIDGVLRAAVVWCWSWRERREGSEVKATKTEREREKKKLLKYLCKCYSNRAYCTVSVAIMHKCTILHPLMWVLFWAKMCKSTTFFYFAKVFTGWCNCSNHPKIPVTLHFFILLKSPNQMDLMYS